MQEIQMAQQTLKKLNLNITKSKQLAIAHTLQTLNHQISWLAEMQKQNEIDIENARLQFQIQQHAARTQLTAFGQIDLLLADKIINLYLDEIRSDTFKKLGWILF